MFKWINAKTELPNDSDHIIMVDDSDQIYSGRGRVFNNRIKVRESGDGRFDVCTHWMLLPEPPVRDIK